MLASPPINMQCDQLALSWNVWRWTGTEFPAFKVFETHDVSQPLDCYVVL